MDNFLFVAMSGAKENMLSQQLHMNNMANASTTGFRSDFATARSQPVFGHGMPSRVYSMSQNPATDFKFGSMVSTGNPMDIAINGDGFLGVLGKDGSEAYTRAGNLKITETPHYKYVSGHKTSYNEYYNKYCGVQLQDNHSTLQFDNLIKNFKPEQYNFEEKRLIIVNNNLKILDGLHRVCLLKKANITKIKVAIYR